ncbi:hypothetical protein E2C01_098719 [Portunus trituberculatus]|uniref:Uncharacterized protein n=1 Tax=Portunus trituberculatus TaxID=210409 RepID=A0A5B7K7N8_PORTR|nr:hypothetical protein [Portunus trituberculatus]
MQGAPLLLLLQPQHHQLLLFFLLSLHHHHYHHYFHQLLLHLAIDSYSLESLLQLILVANVLQLLTHHLQELIELDNPVPACLHLAHQLPQLRLCTTRESQ